MNHIEDQDREIPTPDVAKTLILVAAPFWGAEREIVVRFLRENDWPQDHIRALKFLCHKEAWGSGLAVDENGLIHGPVLRAREGLTAQTPPDLRDRLDFLAASFVKIGDDVSLDQYRQAFLETSQLLTISPRFRDFAVALEEFKHFHAFSMIAKQFYELTITPLSVRKFQATNDLMLQYDRDDIKQTLGQMGSAASQLTEGGGAAIFDGMQQFIVSSSLENRAWAKVGQEVFSEEVEHMRIGVEAVVKMVKTARQLDQVTQAVRHISRRRVSMRNEIFAFPLSSKDITDWIRSPDPVDWFIPPTLLPLVA